MRELDIIGGRRARAQAVALYSRLGLAQLVGISVGAGVRNVVLPWRWGVNSGWMASRRGTAARGVIVLRLQSGCPSPFWGAAPYARGHDTLELFRDDAALDQCAATSPAVVDTGVRLDRTVFYPHGGGQAGDQTLELPDGNGSRSPTRKGATPGESSRAGRRAEALLARLAPGLAVRAPHRSGAPPTPHALPPATHLLCA